MKRLRWHPSVVVTHLLARRWTRLGQSVATLVDLVARQRAKLKVFNGRNSVAMGNTCSGDEAVPSPESWSGFTIPYQVQTSGYRVWLFGDSILDNSYWNGVEAQTTGEWLKRMLPDIEVRDRSTEELDAMSLLNCLQQGKAIGVRDHYVRHR